MNIITKNVKRTLKHIKPFFGKKTYLMANGSDMRSPKMEYMDK